MRSYLTLLAAAFTLLSCNINEKEFSSVSIEEVFSDSISVRAIAPLDTERVWFGANRGLVGMIDSTTPKLASIKYEDNLLEFRSIAIGDQAVYVLNVGSPAVLYRIGFDGEEANSIEEVYTEEGEGVFYDAMAFWNKEEGIAMGDPTDGCLSVIVTRDGGRNWTKIPCDLLPPTDQGEAAFAASNSNISVVGNHAWLVSGGQQARVFHTADKGKSWEVFDTPISSGGPMTGIYSVDFWDEQRGIIVGGDWENKENKRSNKAITSDGGRSWQLVADGDGPGYRSSVRYVPGTEGDGIVALGSPGISYSPDGGVSWSLLSEEGFYALEFVNDTLAFASGNKRIARLIFR